MNLTDINIEQCKAEDILDYIINGLVRDPISNTIKNNIGVPTLTIPDTTSSQELRPNTLYIFTNRSSDLILTLGEPIVSKASEYHCFIVCTGTPTITWPTGISWVGEKPPMIEQDKTYEISILNNIAVYFEA